MMHSREPEPSGCRRIPPAKLRTALAAASPGERVVVMHLLNGIEEVALVRAFEAQRWTVRFTGDLYDLTLIAAIEDPPQLVLTDDPTMARDLSEIWEQARPPIAILVDDRDSAVQGAWAAGADWVITRPFDPDDPLGTGPP